MGCVMQYLCSTCHGMDSAHEGRARRALMANGVAAPKPWPRMRVHGRRWRRKHGRMHRSHSRRVWQRMGCRREGPEAGGAGGPPRPEKGPGQPGRAGRHSHRPLHCPGPGAMNAHRSGRLLPALCRPSQSALAGARPPPGPAPSLPPTPSLPPSPPSPQTQEKVKKGKSGVRLRRGLD